MKNLKQGLLISALIISQPLWSCTENGKEGIVPENDMYISTSAKRSGGLSQDQFNNIIDEIESLYAPIVSSEGGTLKVERNWDDGTVNAYAQRVGQTYRVAMFGGLARHETITEDGFRLVICHEIGHHIGGAPKKLFYGTKSWASNEGQSDYFATLKCLRRAWLNEDNSTVISSMEVPAAVTTSCRQAWANENDYAICVRGAMAGDSVSRLFAALRNNEPAKFETPDSKVVEVTDDRHPATQCRLDTYFQGALCEISMNDNVSTDSEVTGTCHASVGHSIGLRPLCWFKPSIQ